MSETIITIEGIFKVTKCEKNEYGTNANIVEVASDYPQSFMLTLPDGHMWKKDAVMRLKAVCEPVTINPKAGSAGRRFMKFNVKDYTSSPVRVVIEELPEEKASKK